jgi:hypothetical protein
LAEELGDKDFVDWGNQGDPVSASFATDDRGSKTNDMKTSLGKELSLQEAYPAFPFVRRDIRSRCKSTRSGRATKCRRDDIVQFQK